MLGYAVVYLLVALVVAMYLLQISLLKKIDGHDQRYEQIDDGVTQHGNARRGSIRKRTKLERPSKGRLHFERSPSPNGLGGHDEARHNADGDKTRADGHGTDLFDPAANEGQSVKAQDDDTVGECGKPRATYEGDGQNQQAFQEDQKCAAEGMVRKNTSDEIAHGRDAAEHGGHICGDHAGETHPLTQQDLPARDWLCGDGLDGAGSHLTRERIHGS